MNPHPVECREFLDAWAAGVPIPEAHLAICEACAGQVEAGNKMASRLRIAHENSPVPPGLETRVRQAMLGEAGGSARPWLSPSLWIMAAAALILIVSAGAGYQLGHLRWTEAAQDSYIASVSRSVASLLRVGLRDHIHCTFYGQVPKTRPDQREFLQELGPEFKDLLGVVRQHAPAGYEVFTAHQCEYQGRQFVHLAMRGEGKLVSLLIATKGAGESFTAEQIRPVLTRQDTPFYQGQAQRFAISAFETQQYLVYTISDLPLHQNMQLMLAMAPQVKEVLARASL
jgi:hypothetical protein